MPVSNVGNSAVSTTTTTPESLKHGTWTQTYNFLCGDAGGNWIQLPIQAQLEEIRKKSGKIRHGIVAGKGHVKNAQVGCDDAIQHWDNPHGHCVHFAANFPNVFKIYTIRHQICLDRCLFYVYKHVPNVSKQRA